MPSWAPASMSERLRLPRRAALAAIRAKGLPAASSSR